MKKAIFRNLVAVMVTSLVIAVLIRIAAKLQDPWFFYFFFVFIPVVANAFVVILADKRLWVRLIVLIISFAGGLYTLTEYYDYVGPVMDPEAEDYWRLFTMVATAVAISILLVGSAIKSWLSTRHNVA